MFVVKEISEISAAPRSLSFTSTLSALPPRRVFETFPRAYVCRRTQLGFTSPRKVRRTSDDDRTVIPYLHSV